MEKKFNFVYLTTDLVNEKQYVGDHGTNDLNCYKTFNYVGSGDLLTLAIKKYGQDNFKREILEFFPSKKEAFLAQKKYIEKYKTLVTEGGYNISPTGGLGIMCCCSEETKEKIRKKQLGKKASEETKLKMKLSAKKRPPISNETKLKLKLNHGGGVKFHTEETKLKITKTQTGKKTGPCSEQSKLNMSLAQKGKKRNPRPEEVRLKIALGQLKVPKKHCVYCNREFEPGSFKRWHGDNCKFKLEYINKI